MVLLRPQRRVAGAGARRRDAGRLLLRGDRGRARRGHLSHAGLSALSDAYLANGAEPWRIPDVVVARADRGRVRARRDGGEFQPYKRDPETLARPWAIPGTPGLEHRIGGLEKANKTGSDLVRPRQPRPDDAAARAEGRRHQGPRPRGRPPGGRRRARALVGRHVRAGARRRAPRARGRRQGRACAPALAQPVPGEPRRRAAQLRPRADPGDEPGPAAAADPRQVPGRRGRLQPRHRQAVQGRRDRDAIEALL